MLKKSLITIMVIVLGGVAAYAGLVDDPDMQNTTAAKQAASDAVVAVPATRQGSKVYIDPVTGKRGMPPPGVVIPSPPQSAAIVAAPPKIINLGPGKGQAIDMRGHYQEMSAHVDQKGRVTTRCGSKQGQGHATGGEVE